MKPGTQAPILHHAALSSREQDGTWQREATNNATEWTYWTDRLQVGVNGKLSKNKALEGSLKAEPRLTRKCQNLAKVR